MGNSMRSTFGNLCGGQQAAKEIEADDEQRPIAKPKKEKKEKKNKKKNKKLNNGNLPEIQEEKEVKPDNKGVNDKEEATDNAKENIKTDEDSTDSTENEQSSKLLTLKEQASETNLSNVLVPEYEEDDNVSDVIENGSDGSSEHPNTETQEDAKDAIRQPGSRKGTFSSDISSDSREGKLSSSNEDFDQKFDHIHRVVEINPEVLSIGCADEIFDNAASIYKPFVEKNDEFKKAVLQFEKSVDPEKTRPDFERCWKLYSELLDQENERSSKSSIRTASKTSVDVCDVNVNLQAIRGTGTALLLSIKTVRPNFENCVNEAGTVDVIEYVKGKMIEGEQLGITSKFSAPGKYRRNMRQIKNSLEILNNVETDTKDILKSVDSRLGSVSSKKIVNDEILIEPIVKKTEDADDDIFSKLKEDAEEEEEEEDDSTTDGTKTPSESADSNLGDTLLELSGGPNDRSTTPTSIDQTYVIQTIPEQKKTEANNGNLSPLTREILSPQKTHITQVTVEEEDHNTLEFGKYVFIDPSTGDIQVMRNRSRSLDSLVSMTSNRSSLSRFGSFEFVTDFEINIAEKNQSNLFVKP